MTTSATAPRRVRTERGAAAAFPLTSVAWLLIAVSVLIKAWAAFGSWFYEDDFEFLSIIARGDNDLSWYFTRHNVHFMPLSLLLTTPVGMLGGFAWWPAALEITLMNLAAAVACWWMLVRLFGPHPRILAPLVFYLFSPFLIPATTWWAVAINLVAVQAPLFVIIGSHVEYLRTKQRRWLVIAAAMLLIIAGVYVKALVVTAVLGLFTLCYAVEGPGIVRRVVEAVTRWWRMWAVYVAIGVVTAVVYVREGSSQPSQASRGAIGDMFDSLVLHNLVPGLLGGPWAWADIGGFPRQLAAPSTAGVAISLMLLVVGFAFAIQRWEDAWLPLIFLAPPVVVTFVALAALRANEFGSLVGLEPKYWADVVPYFTLALGVLVMPVLGLPPVHRSRISTVPPLPVFVVVAVAAAYVASSLVSTMSYVNPWHTDFPARQFVQGAVAAGEDAGPGGIDVADIGAPDAALSGTYFPYNKPNYLFAPTPGVVTGVSADVDLEMLDAFGQPIAARPHQDMVVDLSDRACVKGATYFDLPARTIDYAFWVTITATYDRTTTVDVAANSTRHTLEVPSGRHDVTFWVPGAFDRIWFTASDGRSVCPETITIGAELEPR